MEGLSAGALVLLMSSKVLDGEFSSRSVPARSTNEPSNRESPPYKVLFLDIDGVMNNVKGGCQCVFDEALVRRVADIVRRTECKVVWTTYWRGFEDYITYVFCRIGELPHEVVIGRTAGEPHLNYLASNKRVYTSRLDEIKKWMEEHPKLVERYVILDDRDVVPPEDPAYARFVQPTYSRGITEEEAERVVRLFEED